MTLRSFFGEGGIGSSIFKGAKGLGQSSKVGITAAAESVQGAVAPSKTKIEVIYPTVQGREYLEELQSSGQIEGEDHWAFQMLGTNNQTSQAFINRMITEHNYKGTRNQLVKNINEMHKAGYISGIPQPQEEEVSF